MFLVGKCLCVFVSCYWPEPLFVRAMATGFRFVFLVPEAKKYI